MPICSSMGLAVVVMVVRVGTSGGLNGEGSGRGKVGWVAIRVEEGGVDT